MIQIPEELARDIYDELVQCRRLREKIRSYYTRQIWECSDFQKDTFRDQENHTERLYSELNKHIRGEKK